MGGVCEPLNVLAPGKFVWNFRWVNFKLNLVINGWDIFCEIPLRWMSLDLAYDKSTLVQVMAWCHQATSHYLSQCWPKSMSSYGFPRPLCVNPLVASSVLLPTILWNMIILYSVWSNKSTSNYPLVINCSSLDVSLLLMTIRCLAHMQHG